MKIKLGPEQMSVNGKTVSIMDSVLAIVSQYNAEIAEANRKHTEAKQEIDRHLTLNVKTINERYEEKLLGLYSK